VLFNSFAFIFVFLPICLTVYLLLGTHGFLRGAMVWLFATSLFFYGWWNPSYLWLILASILFNYTIGTVVLGGAVKHKRLFLILGITGNLCGLGYYKYSNFFIENINSLSEFDFTLHNVILPLGISFFTFQQIAYLVDSSRRKTRDYNFLHYCLFVTFFPQLIAGPIVHHREMMSQFTRPETYRLRLENLSVGSTIFFIGLFKKVVLADSAAVYSTSVFSAAEDGAVLTLVEAWGGALSYTFQLYFDFSGYSDMAVGGAYLFGIRLPINFFEPYKSRNIREFWRRWHVTLSRFLKEHVYFPLGGNKKGAIRQNVNLMSTMVLGGLWHGAGWTFVIWGALHGLYLIVGNIWRRFNAPLLRIPLLRRPSILFLAHCFSWGLTFICIVIAWVFFRANTFDGAVAVIIGMFGGNGFYVPSAYAGLLGAFEPVIAALGGGFAAPNSIYLDQFFGLKQVALLSVFLLIVLAFPTTTRILGAYKPVIDPLQCHAWPTRLKWRPNVVWGLVIAGMAITALVMAESPSEFLYFQF